MICAADHLDSGGSRRSELACHDIGRPLFARLYPAKITHATGHHLGISVGATGCCCPPKAPPVSINVRKAGDLAVACSAKPFSPGCERKLHVGTVTLRHGVAPGKTRRDLFSPSRRCIFGLAALVPYGPRPRSDDYGCSPIAVMMSSLS